ncbi:hypothetical protein [Flagellimonas marinaquae]
MEAMEVGASMVEREMQMSDAEKERKRLAKEEEKMKKIPWNDQPARKVIHQDCHPNGLLYGMEYSDELAEKVWMFYPTLKEFRYISVN